MSKRSVKIKNSDSTTLKGVEEKHHIPQEGFVMMIQTVNLNSTGDEGMIMRSTSFSVLNTSHVVFCPITK